jgi:O-methyltransferase
MKKKINESFALYNKQYTDEPDGPYLRLLQKAFYRKLIEPSGSLPDHSFYADDCFVVYRNLGFLSDTDFTKACTQAELDQVLLGRIWRIYILAWSMSQIWDRGGTIIDAGTYNGKAFEAALRYSISSSDRVTTNRPRNRLIVADMFENPPEEARKREHSPILHLNVERRLNSIYPTEIVKGILPQSLDSLKLTSITWLQIDLNSASADLETFSYLFDYLANGAYVIFDDYGFSRYQATYTALNEFIKEKSNNRILELPSGQGLYINS